MPEWLQYASPIIAVVSVTVNVIQFLAKRRLDTVHEEDRRRLAAQVDRERVSRGIAEKLGALFSAYAVEVTKDLKQVQKLRMEWGNEAMVIDIVDDENLGRELTRLVNAYLDSLTLHVQGNLQAADVHIRRSDSWRQARRSLEEFVQKGRQHA